MLLRSSINLTNLTGIFLFQRIVLSHASSVGAQPHDPIQWTLTTTKLNEDNTELVFTAKPEGGWQGYACHLKEGGPLPATFTLKLSSGYTSAGQVKEESVSVRSDDLAFMKDIIWVSGTAVFTQKVTLQVPVVTIKGTMGWDPLLRSFRHTLPSFRTMLADRKDSHGPLFMAATPALVFFCCTGLLRTLLMETA